MSVPPLRLAISQLPMRWEGQDNTRAILDDLAAAARAGAHLCAFPELAVTGFHRRIAEMATPERVAASLQAIRQACAAHTVAVAVGAPTFGDDGRIYNSHVWFDEHGQALGAVAKNGLTAPEATFFARGSTRPVVELRGRTCTAVICREVEDADEVCAQLAAGRAPEIVLWPGLMGPQDGCADVDPPAHVRQAQTLARRLRAHVVQSNWPNSLNYPSESARTGRSAVIDPAGELLFRLPQAEPGLAVFTLGERSYEWTAARD